MRNNASSRTAVFALLMNLAIASCASLDQAPVITSVAADVRKIYGAEDTLRDCTDTIPLVFDADIQALPMQRQLALYRQMIVDAMQPEVRLAVAAEIKKNNQLMEKRNPSLAGKRQFCKWVHQYSYSNYTYSISNIGLVSLGEGIESHVLGVDSIMCANTYPVMIEILQYKQQYHICYCTRLHHDPYVQKFYELLTSAGISCTCEQRENYVEALAVF